MITDAAGRIEGVFNIPDPNFPGNPKFPTGEIEFKLSSDSTRGDMLNIDNPVRSKYTGTASQQSITDGFTIYYATGMFDMYQTVKTCGLLAAIMGCDPEEEPGPLLDEEGNEDTLDDPVAFFKFSNALVVKGGDRYNVYTDPTQFLSNAALKREQVRLARRYNKEEYNRVQ